MANEGNRGLFSGFGRGRQDETTIQQAESILAEGEAMREQAKKEAEEIIRKAKEEAAEIVEKAKAENSALLEENEKLITDNSKIKDENESVQAEYAEKKERLRLNEEAQSIIDERDQIILAAEEEADKITNQAKAEAESQLTAAKEESDRVKAEFDDKKTTLKLNEEAQAIIDSRDTLLKEGKEAKEKAEEEARNIIGEAQEQSMETINKAIEEADKKIKDATANAEQIVAQAEADAEIKRTEAGESGKGIISAAKAEAEKIIEKARSEATTSASEIIDAAHAEEERVIGRKETAAKLAAQSIIDSAEADAQRIRTSANEYAERQREEASKEAIAIRQNAEEQAEKAKEEAQKVVDAQRESLEKQQAKLHEDQVAIATEKAKIPDLARTAAEERTEAQKKALDDREAKLCEKSGELAEKERDLQWRKEAFESEKRSFDQSLQQAVEQRYSTICGELDASRQNEKRLSDANKTLNDRYRRLTDMYRSTQGDDVKRLQEEKEALQAKLDKIAGCGITEDNAQAFRDQAAEAGRFRKKNEELLVKLTEAKNTAALMAGSEEKLAVAETEADTYKRMVSSLMQELDNRKRVSRNEMIAPIQNPPRFLTGPRPVKDPKDLMEEVKWLDHILKQSEKSGIILSKRFLYAYHTSLKINEWSPMVVLAGVSGTGKSELPRQYARHGGMHFVSIPVKPDWDSPASLFGYFNAIENRFEATELLRALYQMQSKQDREGDMLLVLLDEMNLAHPEQYFADLLSKFEEARNSDEYAEYDIALGSGEQAEKLQIGRNVLWTGTMNEDETTKGLSDKVIDRSMLITFPCPEKLYDRDNTPLQAPQLTLSHRQWDAWKGASLKRTQGSEIEKELTRRKETIQKINFNMSAMGRNLGHRVWQSIENYILNYPTVIEKKGNPDEIEKAFCDAIAFKLMPKFRGLETSNLENEKHLDDIATIIPTELREDFRIARQQTSEVFRWNSAKFMEEKKD